MPPYSLRWVFQSLVIWQDGVVSERQGPSCSCLPMSGARIIDTHSTMPSLFVQRLGNTNSGFCVASTSQGEPALIEVFNRDNYTPHRSSTGMKTLSWSFFLWLYYPQWPISVTLYCPVISKLLALLWSTDLLQMPPCLPKLDSESA